MRGHLAAAIGEVSGIVPLKLQVGEIERLLAGGRDVDDAGGAAALTFSRTSRVSRKPASGFDEIDEDVDIRVVGH